MTKKPLSHYIKSKKEATSLLNRALSLSESSENKEFVVFNSCMSARFETSDIPAELTAVVDTPKASVREVCDGIYGLYARLISEGYDSAHKELPAICDGTNSFTRAEELLCILCGLGALYNMFMDTMESYVKDAGEKPCEICTAYDESMYGMYSQVGMKLVNEFIEIAY